MKNIPLLDLKAEYLHMKKDIDAAIDKCLTHQRWIKGPEVEELEEKVSRYLNVEHCVGVASGTDALVIALRALAIKLTGNDYFTPEDEIITTPFTFVATGDAILRAKASPVFVDIDPGTLCIDPHAIETYLENSNGRVVGILPVHLYGQSCDMDSIKDIAKRHRLFIVEDVAQAFGGAWKNKRLGGIGDMGALSFFPSKNLGGFGDGGMVTTNDKELADISKMLLQHGGKDKNNAEHIGYNSRLDTLQAAVLLAKMKYVDEMNELRRSLAKQYDEEFIDVPGVKTLKHLQDSHSVYNQYTIIVEGGKRDYLAEHLKDEGITTAIYYSLPLHKIDVFKVNMKVVGSLTNAETVSKQVISLPVEPFMQIDDIRRVCEEIKLFIGQ